MAPIEEQSAVLTFPQPPAAFFQPPTANYSPKAANKAATKYDFDLLNNNVGIKNGTINSTAQPLLAGASNRRAASELPSEKSAKMAAVAAATSSSSGHIIRSSSLGPANPRQYLEAFPGRPGSRNCYLEPPQTNNNSIYETNYETIDGYSSGSGRTSDDCAITMLENAVRCLDAAREAKARQQQLYQQKALMFNNKDSYNNDNFYNSSASRYNNKVQYDSITVLGGGRDTPPPPPPPLPRTKSFKEKEATARVKFLNGGGDGRASSAPPISPYLYRKFGLYKRLDFKIINFKW